MAPVKFIPSPKRPKWTVAAEHQITKQIALRLGPKSKVEMEIEMRSQEARTFHKKEEKSRGKCKRVWITETIM